MVAENPADVAVRPVTAHDIATVVEFRTRMFRELGWRDEERLSQVEPLFASYLAEELERGGCSGFIAENVGSDGTVTPAGTIVIVWQRVPPGVRNLAGRQAYLLGMFVEPGSRRRGLARALARRAVQCAVENGAPLVTLHASDLGRPLYEQLGFKASSEMRLFTELATPPAWVEVVANTD